MPSTWDYVTGEREIIKNKKRWCPPNFMKGHELYDCDEEEE